MTGRQNLLPTYTPDGIFKYFTAQEKQFILSITRPTLLLPGESLVRENDQHDNLYLITRGSLEVMRADDVVTTLGAGDVLGELAFVSGVAWTATVRAVDPTSIHILERAQLQWLATEAPELLGKLMLAVCDILGARLRAEAERGKQA